MSKTLQEEFHARAVAAENNYITNKYEDLLNDMLNIANKGEYCIELPREKIPVELMNWLIDQGFELYTDTGKDNDWENTANFYFNVFHANRIKIVW